MKKKLIFVFTLVLLVFGAYVALKPSFEMNFKDSLVFEYGQRISDQDIVLNASHKYSILKKYDSMVVGKQDVIYKIEDGLFNQEFKTVIEIKDTKAPVITLKRDQVSIYVNEAIDLKSNIKSVVDSVDGELSYQIEGKVNNQKPGIYKINVIAKDQHALTSEKSFSVKVLEKQEIVNIPITPQRPLNNKVICINAGHQGRGNSALEPIGPNASKKKAKVSSGATGISTRIPESQTTLKVALKLRDELQRRGYSVIMTRTSQNVNLSNMQRAMIGNQASATIHLHCDGGSKSARGAHTIAIKKDNPYCASLYQESSRFASSVINAYCKETGIKNRGVSYRNDLTGLNFSKVPAIYIEMGFISHPNEDQMLNSDSFQVRMVNGIANGIDSYFKH